MPLGIHNPTYSLKPHRGRSWKRARRIEIVALLESKFISDQDIANHLGITVGAVQAIKSTPEYQAKRITLQTGLMSQYDQNFGLTEEEQRDELNQMVPMALSAMKRALTDPLSPHHYKAVQDVIDRNPATAKISKMEHSLKEEKDINKENLQARELLKMLGEEEPAPKTLDLTITPDQPLYAQAVGVTETEEDLEKTEARDKETIEEIKKQEVSEIDLAKTEVAGPVN